MKLNGLEKTILLAVVLMALVTCVVRAGTELTDKQIDAAQTWSKKYGLELLQNMLDGKLPSQSVIDANCRKAAEKQYPSNRVYSDYVSVLVNDIVKVASERFATVKAQNDGDETQARIAVQNLMALLK